MTYTRYDAEARPFRVTRRVSRASRKRTIPCKKHLWQRDGLYRWCKICDAYENMVRTRLLTH